MSSSNNDHDSCPILLKYSTTVQATEHSHVVLDISLSFNTRRRHWCRPQKERSRAKYYLPVHVTLIEVPCPRSWVENYCSISIYKRPRASLLKYYFVHQQLFILTTKLKEYIYYLILYHRELKLLIAMVSCKRFLLLASFVLLCFISPSAARGKLTYRINLVINSYFGSKICKFWP